jgi:hypothetical protein
LTVNNSCLFTAAVKFFTAAKNVHLVNHLVTVADLHRAERYDRMSHDVLTLTGQGPLSVQEFVRKNAATFTASAKEAISGNA